MSALAAHTATAAPPPEDLADGRDRIIRLLLDEAGKRGIKIDVAKSYRGGTVDRAIDQASTISIDLLDHRAEITRSGLVDRQRVFDLRLDGRSFRLVQRRKQGSTLTLTLESKTVAVLRGYKGARRATRGKVTRAEFAKQLLAEVKGHKIRLVCPELHKRQPIASERDREPRSERDKRREPGFAPGAKLTVKHEPATSSQRDFLERVLDVGISKSAPPKLLVCSVMTITQESNVENLDGSKGDWGLFSQRRNGAWPASRDVERDAAAFFDAAIAANKARPNLSYADLCQAVQASGAGASYYAKWETEARRTVSAYGVDLSGSTTLEVEQPFHFERKKGENTWACLNRLFADVGWRVFVVDEPDGSGTLYIISEQDLMASRPVMSFTEGDAGVSTIDYDDDDGKHVNTAAVTCRIDRWEADPGQVIEITDFGTASGRWLVSSISRPLSNPQATIQLRRGAELQREKAEPAPETATLTIGETKTVPGSRAKILSNGKAAVPDEAPDEVKAIIAAANQIISKPYGHAEHTVDGTVHDQYDCSSAVAHALYGARLVERNRNYVSGDFESMWEAGAGEWVTVYANGGHVFLEVAGLFLNTAHYGATTPPGDGPRWSTTKQTSSGYGSFAVRHPHGL